MSSDSAQPALWNRHPWLFWGSAGVAAVVLLASFLPHGDPIPIRAVTAERGTIRSVVSTNGKIEPVRDFEAHAPTSTTVKRLLVKEGDHVKKGQLLVQLNDAQARSQAAHALAQVKSSEADQSAMRSGGSQEEMIALASQIESARRVRDAAQRNLDAINRLQQSGSASPGEARESQAALTRAAADLAFLEQKKKDRYSQIEKERSSAQQTDAQSSYAAAEDVLSQLSIRAPFDGVVYSVPVKQGAYVNPGDLVIEEADLSKVTVRAFVDEPDVGRLQDGQPMEITWDAVPGRVWHSQVGTVPSALKMHGTRNVGELVSTVDNPDAKLLPNVNVNVTVVVGEDHNVLTVPREALRQDDRGMFVLTVSNNKLKRSDVTTSIINLTDVEVTHGLYDRAEVALNSINLKPLQSGNTVRVVQ